MQTFEHLELSLETGGRKVTIVTIYRSEPSPKHNFTLDGFFNELTELLSIYHVNNTDFILVGDFNFHINNLEDARTKRFLEVLEIFDLVQHVTEPTHQSGNILDLVITQRSFGINNCIVSEHLSDHSCVLFDAKIAKPQPLKRAIRYRKTKSININQLKQDIKFKLKLPFQSSSILYLSG
jgi:endonuclease/exonuclease/phosphatase family metal-dependent hydrolase